jgi:hypothetical protein
VRLHALRSEHFVAVVCGFAPSSVAAVTTVDSMLDHFTPRSSDMDKVPNHDD